MKRVLMWDGLGLLFWLAYLVVRHFLLQIGRAAVLAILALPVYGRLSLRIVEGRAPALITVAVQVDVTTMGPDSLKQTAAVLFAESGSILQNVADLLIEPALALFVSFFQQSTAYEIMTAIRRLLPMTEDRREELISRTRDLIW